jgi:hypothetical protein
VVPFEIMLPSELANKIDDLMKADLLYWRDLWFDRLLLSVRIVVIGLILEGPELIHEFISIRGRIRIDKSSASLQEFHTPDWVKIVALLGWLFIVVGLTGEWVTDAVLSTADSNLQAFNDILLAEATKEAGNAKTSAEGAENAASRAKTLADAAGGAAAKAQQQVEAVAQRAGDIDADLARTQILLSARHVQNRDVLAEKVKQEFKAKDIVLSSYIGDQEGWGLCTDLLSVAIAAEMKPVNECGLGPFTAPLTSPLKISGPDIDETVKLADLLLRIGRIGGWSAMKSPVLTIFVGAKMTFVMGQARSVPTPSQKTPKKKQIVKP